MMRIGFRGYQAALGAAVVGVVVAIVVFDSLCKRVYPPVAMMRIGFRGYLLALGTAVVGVVVGTLVPPMSTEATVILFAIGVILIALSSLGRRPQPPAEPPPEPPEG